MGEAKEFAVLLATNVPACRGGVFIISLGDWVYEEAVQFGRIFVGFNEMKLKPFSSMKKLRRYAFFFLASLFLDMTKSKKKDLTYYVFF